MKMMENKMDALAHTLGAKVLDLFLKWGLLQLFSFLAHISDELFTPPPQIDSPLVPYPGWLPNPLSDALKVVQVGLVFSKVLCLCYICFYSFFFFSDFTL